MIELRRRTRARMPDEQFEGTDDERERENSLF